MKNIGLIVILLNLLPFLGISQDLKIHLGAGIPDLIHLEVSSSISKKSEIGLQIGTILFYENTVFVPTIEHRFYFKESKKHQNLNTWFFGQRGTYYYEKSDAYRWKTVFFNLSIGRNMYINKNFGISLDGGLFATIYNKQFNVSDGQEVDNDCSNCNHYILPNLRLQLFYKI